MTGSAVVVPLAPRLQRDRYLVPDVARGVAIMAMLIAHAGPIMVDQPAATAFLQGQLNDVASPLFATTMGAAAAIVLAKAGPSPANVRTVILQNVIRGAILVLLGLLLATWGSWIAIVLSFLGIVLAIGTPLVLLGTRTLIAVLAAVLVFGAPLNNLMLAATGPLITVGERTPASFLLEWLFLSPHYRVTNLLPWFLFGALLFRIRFGGRRAGWILLAIAVPAWWLGPLWRGATGEEFSPSGSYLDTLHDAGLVLGVLGVIILLASLRGRRTAAVVRAVFLPFEAIGSISLSLYVFQVAVVAWMSDNGISFGTTDPVAWIVLVLGVPLVGILWWRFVGKGPIEWLIGVVTGRYRLRAQPPR
ncbi:acyltransferase family protein [Cryobacterium sp. N22]|uniref:acyltransferase family protein n=1 Tax=Cryobacterium sp. N22 TaxID=2048290 RepID=UPI000CE42E05|nr:acyltransferase family protein [Cryobacterium sp. N22]